MDLFKDTKKYIKKITKWLKNKITNFRENIFRFFKSMFSGVKRITETVKKRLQQLKNNVVDVFNKYILFNVLFFFFKVIHSKKYFKAILKLILVFLFVLVIISLSVGGDLLSFGIIEDEILSNYSFAVGGMLGTVIAIVFALSIFALQKTTELYSSRFFRIYTFGWREIFTYTFIVIIDISFFVLGIMLNNDSSEFAKDVKVSLIYASLFALIAVFLLLAWHYNNVKTKTDPIKALSFLNNKVKDIFNKINKQTFQSYEITRLRNKTITKEQILAGIFHGYTHKINELIDDAFYITTRLSDNNDVNGANKGLNVICNTLISFLDLRKKSLHIVWSNTYTFAHDTDSSNFLALILERLQISGETFTKEKKLKNARFVLDSFQDLAKKSTELEFGYLKFENPIFNLIRGYFFECIRFAIRENEREVVFSGAKILGNMGVMATEAELSTAVSTIQENLYEISINHLMKDTFILDYCMDGYINIIRVIIKNRSASIALQEALKNVEDIICLVYSMPVADSLNKMTNDLTKSQLLQKPFEDISSIIGTISSEYSDLKDADDKQKLVSIAYNFIEKIYLLLRNVAHKTDVCNSALGFSFSNIIERIDQFLLNIIDDDDLKMQKSMCIKYLKDFMNLPSFIVLESKSKELSYSLHNLTNTIYGAALVAIDNKNEDEIIQSSIDSLFSIAKNIIEQKFQQGEAKSRDTFLNVIKLGVVLNKVSKEDMSKEVIEKIHEFEGLYHDAYLKTASEDYARQHNIEASTFFWRNTFVTELSQFPFHENIEHNLIDILDIDRFIFKVWESYNPDSPIKDEFEKD